MATWMAHLRIAENLLDMLPGLAAAPFAVGNIAPDSGIPDANWEHFTPPGEVTHFKRPDRCPYYAADLEFYQHYLRPPLRSDSDVQRASFLWGYFCHLVTDNLWHRDVGQPTRARFPAQFAADPRFIWEVKQDWYGLDFVYARTHPQALFWRIFLACDYPISYLDMLPAAGVRRNIAYIQDYYQRTDAHVAALCSRERVYLTEAEMDQFVATTTAHLAQVYQRLQAGPDTTGHCSVLAWEECTFDAPPYPN